MPKKIKSNDTKLGINRFLEVCEEISSSCQAMSETQIKDVLSTLLRELQERDIWQVHIIVSGKKYVCSHA